MRWTFFTPIANLIIDAAVGREITISGVRFIASERLPYIYKQLGLSKPFSEFRLRNKLDPEFFKRASTYAAIHGKGDIKDQRGALLNRVHDALSVLCLSGLGYSRRRTASIPTIMGFSALAKFSFMFVNKEAPVQSPGWQLIGTIQPMRLDRNWKGFQKEAFFLSLLDALNGNTTIEIESGWRKTLWDAAVLAGRSQESRKVGEAFLWNMIVLEMLLTQQGDTYVEALPQRIESFLGWAGFWQSANYEEHIRNLYQMRCKIVHTGDFSSVSVPDLLFSDDLVLHMFDNIVNHLKIFPSKKAVIEFSQKVGAEKLLGARPRVRPRTLRVWGLSYTQEDMERLY